MAASFYFYDLETSGFNPRETRIMQFAGQRTDLKLEPVGEPLNVLIKMTDDIAPDPDAVLLTGITPQATLAEGVTEREFLQQFHESITMPDTIFVGFNSVRFDDEFMRALHYRNFYDPYEWQWQDGRSRWDMLDVVRMTRALRPDGIKWPFAADGSPTNRLELLTALNGLDHQHAHDALNDVEATIAVARLIRSSQTKLFDYLLNMRDKKSVAKLALGSQPFVYTSGKYPGEFEKTTVVATITEHPRRAGALVYDLRHDPTEFAELSSQELAEKWRWQKEPDSPRLPVKLLRFNVCPAVAPLSVMDEASQKRLKLDMKLIQKHYKLLKQNQKAWTQKLLLALDILDGEQQTRLLEEVPDVDSQIYDGFFENADKQTMRAARAAAPEDLSLDSFSFADKRLKELLPLYKARNFPRSLNSDEHAAWDNYRQEKLLGGGTKSRLVRYFDRLKTISEQGNLTAHQQFLLEELQLYGQSIMPAEALADE